jgi:membrane-associated phospholipid phosphatase
MTATASPEVARVDGSALVSANARTENLYRPPTSSFAFEISPLREGALLLLAALAVAAVYLPGDRLVLRRCPPCDISAVNRFDRRAVRPPISGLGPLSYALEIAAIAAPAAIALRDRGFSRELAADLLVYTEAFALNSALNIAAKTLVQRPTPLLYLGLDPLLARKASSYRSFYSGHTAQIANALVANAVMSRLRGRTRAWPWACAAVGTAVMGAARVGAGKHFYSDVCAGALVGAMVGALVPLLHPVVSRATRSI